MCNTDCWYAEVCGVKHEDCEKTCVRYHEMKFLMDNSNIPKNKQGAIALYPSECDLDAFNRLADIKDNIVDFVEQGKNLYICSNINGNGKSSWSLKLLMKYFDEIWDGNGFVPRGVIIHVPTFFVKCKDFKTEDPEFEALKKLLLDVDLVVWDDIAGVSMSNYDYSQLLVYLDAREFKGLSNIFTSNITDRDTLAQAVGDKITSRVWNSSTEVVEFKGGDRR